MVISLTLIADSEANSSVFTQLQDDAEFFICVAFFPSVAIY